jgi:hypothetical protein
MCVAFAQSPPATSSVSGIIRLNDAPAASLLVTLTDVNGIEINHCETDASGRYSFGEIPSGRVQLRFKNKSDMQEISILNLKPGPNPNQNITLNESARVSGVITDKNRKPLKGIPVALVSAEYALGALRQKVASSAITNDRGEYTVVAPPGRAYYVLAHKSALIPAYYPGVESIDGATVVASAAGSKRELVDFQMKSAPTHCLEATIQTPDAEKPSLYELSENVPPLWTVATLRFIGPRTPAPADGRIKVCDLHPGEYWIKTYSSGDPHRGHGIEFVTIGDKDVTGIVTGPQPQFPVDASVIWDDDSSADPSPVKLSLVISSTIGEYGGTSVAITGPLPRRFAFPVTNHGYVLAVENIPAGAYLKDITYSGRSILNEVFEPGSAAAADGMRITLARDGARISLKAADKDNAPVAEANIVVIPASTVTEAAAATAMVIAKTDSYGAWTSGPIAPGQYYVIATTSPVNRSPDAFAKLWRARSATNMVELAPNFTAQVTRTPGAIE